jgi:CSLREA domain-containing protein
MCVTLGDNASFSISAASRGGSCKVHGRSAIGYLLRVAATRLSGRLASNNGWEKNCIIAVSIFALACDCSLTSGQNPRFSRENGKTAALHQSRSELIIAADKSNKALAGDVHANSTPVSIAPAVNFGGVNVGSASPTTSVSFTFSGSVTLGGDAVLTQGATGLDFADAGTGSCATGASYSSGNTCTVNATFSPRFPGTRYGAAILKDNSGNTIATGYVQGIGLGPQATFLPGTQTSVAVFTDPEAVATDGNGNIFVADYDLGAVYEETPSGAGYTQTEVVSGLSGPVALAIDGAGNLYVADLSAGNVYKETRSNGSYTQSIIGAGFVAPDGVTVDGNGNVYVADFGIPYTTPITPGGLYKETLSNGSYTQTAIGNGLNSVTGLKVDGSGDIFVTALTSYQVSGALYKESLSGGNYSQSILSASLVSPLAVWVDASGNLYVADDNNASGTGGVIYKEILSGGTYSQTLFITSIRSPEDVVLDDSGNLFIPDFTSANVYKINLASPAPLAFGNTSVGSSSGAQTVTAENIGNESLIIEIPNSGSNPSIAQGFSLNSGASGACPLVSFTSSTPGTLAAGSSCAMPVTFAPLATGNYSGSLLLTNNNLSAVAPGFATQTFALSGTGTGIDKAQSLLISGPSSAPFNTLFSIGITAIDTLGNTDAAYNGTVTFTSSDPGFSNPGPVTLVNGVGHTSIAFKMAGVDTLTATDSTNSSLFGTGTFTVPPGPATHLGITAPGSAGAGKPISVTVTAYDVAGNVATSYSGIIHFTSADPGAQLPPDGGLTSGTWSFNATLATEGQQTITATDIANSFSATTGDILVSVPLLVVTTTADDAGAPGNCTQQAVAGIGTDAACSLRDALLYTSNAGSGNISFSSTVFAATNSVAQNTIALNSGALILPSNATITGPTNGTGSTRSNLATVSGNSLSTVFSVNSGVTNAHLTSLTITDGSGQGPGGGIDNKGILTVTNCTISANSVIASQQGGGIYNSGTLTVNSSTLSGNSATEGGGIYNSGTLALSNSTIAGNLVTGNGVGGGIYNLGTSTLNNTTVSANSAKNGGGIVTIANNGPGVIKLSNSTVAGNSATTNPDVDSSSGTVTDNGGNVTDVSGVDLAPLANYGGPMQTMLPLPGSPAICGGLVANASSLLTDERDDPRSTSYAASACVDAGAVQTNYSLTFSTEPPSSVVLGLTIAPAPVVRLTESGVVASAAASAVSISGGPAALSGTTTANLSFGTAVFNNAAVIADATDEMLSAALTLTGSLSLSATSSSFSVAPNQAVAFTSIAPVTYGITPFSLAAYASASSGLPVTFQVISGPATVNGTIVTITGAGSVVLQASQAGNGAYSVALPVRQTLTVNKSVLQLTTTNASVTYGAVLPTFGFTVSGLVNGDSATQAFSGAPQLSTTAVQGSGVGTYPITASMGTLVSASYTFQFASAKLTVTKASLTFTANSLNITFGSPIPPLTYILSGLASGDTAATAITGSPLLSTTATNSSPSGNYPISISAGSLAATNYNFQFVNATLTISPVRIKPVVDWVVPTAIPYGTLLSATQLDATANVVGTFVYSPAVGAMLTAGLQTLSVTFTPADTTDYSTATATVNLTVIQVTPLLSWPTPTPIDCCNPLSAAQLNASASVPGLFTYKYPSGSVLPPGSWKLIATFTPTDTVDYTDATSSVTLIINKGTPAIIWGAPASITYGTALSGKQLDAKSSVNGTFAYTPPGGTSLAVGSYTLSTTLSPTSPNDYNSATATVPLTVNQATPQIAWTLPAAISYGTPLSAAQLDASSTVPGTFAYSPALGTVLAAGTQTLSVVFTPTDMTDYTSSTYAVKINVSEVNPVVTWATPAAISYGTALSSIQLDAATSVAGTFAYSPSFGTILTAGPQTLSVTFTPTDAIDFATVTSTVQLTVNKVTPAIVWGAPAAISCCTPLTSVQLNASAAVPGAFAYNWPLGSVLPAGTWTLTAVFTPTDTTDYSTAKQSETLIINKGTPVIVWAAPASISYGTALSGAQLDAESAVNGTFSYTPPSGTVLKAGLYTLAATLNPTSTTDYNSAMATVPLTVNKATPLVTWAAPAAISYGTPLSSTQLNATASVDGTFTYSPGVGAVLSAGQQRLSVTFIPTDTADYASTTNSVKLTVGKATPTITWATPADIPYGTALSATQLDATASVSGSFAYNWPAGTVLAGGSWTLTATFTPTDAVDYAQATANVVLIVDKVAPVVSWPTPAVVTYGTALGAAQLNATASVAGTFAYSPPPGTVLTAGAHTVMATFTPSAGADYSVVTASVTMTVSKATPVINWATPEPINCCNPITATQLNATAPVAGAFTYNRTVGTVLPPGSWPLSVNFVPNDAADYNTAASNVTLIINKGNPVIVWTVPVSIPYGSPLGAKQLDAEAAVNGTFTYTPGAGAILHPGSYTLSTTLTPNSTADYNPATATVPLTVTKATPVITWATPAPIVCCKPIATTQLDASSSVPGTFEYNWPVGTVLPGGSWKLTATFSPTDTTDYGIATASVTLIIKKGDPVIVWSKPAAIAYGTALSGKQLGAKSSVSGKFAYTPPIGAVLKAGTYMLSTTFTPTSTTDYNVVSASVSLTVKKATPAITWATPAPISCCTALTNKQLNATSPVAGTFVYNWPAGSVLPAGSWKLIATFTPTDTSDYSQATASVTLTIEKGTPVITWATPAAIAYGTALSARQLDAKAEVSGTFAYSPEIGAVLSAGSHSLSTTLTPTSTTDYNAATATVSIVVNKASLTVTANNLSIVAGSPLPKLTYTLNGFVNGDTAGASITGTPALTTNATPQSQPGTYSITPSAGTLGAANYGFDFVGGTLTVTPAGTAATPEFSVAAGTYATAQSVTLVDTTTGAIIYYTTNGSTPTASSTKYTQAINVSASETIKAVALAPGFKESAVASAAYTIN